MPQGNDYLSVLQALSELPFPVGKKLLMSVLRGEEHDSVKKHKLDKLSSYGSMLYEEDELRVVIDKLVRNGLIAQVPLRTNKFIKLLEISGAGRKELDEPTLHEKSLVGKNIEYELAFSEAEEKLRSAFSFYLDKYNIEQQKAIIGFNNKILCIAGPGSGKTTVLTKRIDFLTKYRSVPERKILAITFTRKAKQEMKRRLGLTGVHVETFNSFCEGILREHAQEVYGRSVRVMSFKDKFRAFKLALNQLKITPQRLVSVYFTTSQQRGKTQDQLLTSVMRDCFVILDYFKMNHKPLQLFGEHEPKHKFAAQMVYHICTYIEDFMKRNGLRDFTDQLLDTIAFFEKNKEKIPHYAHILVDEYQDVNDAQIALLKLLNGENLFCVGDPRQSIFGWRGSKIEHILEFKKEYPEADIVPLTKNYRSTGTIVEAVNTSIKHMGLPDLEKTKEGETSLKLIKCKQEIEEFQVVISAIQMQREKDVPLSEIFVLARTNRTLTDFSEQLKVQGIPFILKTDDVKGGNGVNGNGFGSGVGGGNGSGAVTLATVHAIKGLEAQTVFILTCNNLHFPCRTSDHPIVELVSVGDYDKEEEERRLLYVAMSRAKESLYILYTGTLTHFISKELRELFDETVGKGKPVYKVAQRKPGVGGSIGRNLSGGSSILSDAQLIASIKTWRREKAMELGVKPYMILHDKSVVALATEKPGSVEELGGVYGFGPSKIARFGEEVMGILGNK